MNFVTRKDNQEEFKQILNSDFVKIIELHHRKYSTYFGQVVFKINPEAHLGGYWLSDVILMAYDEGYEESDITSFSKAEVIEKQVTLKEWQPTTAAQIEAQKRLNE